MKMSKTPFEKVVGIYLLFSPVFCYMSSNVQVK